MIEQFQPIRRSPVFQLIAEHELRRQSSFTLPDTA